MLPPCWPQQPVYPPWFTTAPVQPVKELKWVITAVANGGAIQGGIGSIEGTIWQFVLAMIYNAFIMSGVSAYYQDVFTGLCLSLLLSFERRCLEKNNSNRAPGVYHGEGGEA